MGIYVNFSVLRVGSDGEVLLEHIRSPEYSVHDSLVHDLFSPADNARFAAAVDGLDFRWYTHTTMAACLAERRNPRRADCFEPDELLRDLVTVRDRLERMGDTLPRRYGLRTSAHPDREETFVRFFHDGKAFGAGCGWNSCKATWNAYRRTPLANITHLLTEPSDAEIDLRHRTTFACREVIGPQFGPDEGLVEGPPMTLYVSSSSAFDVFRPHLDDMIAFAREARTGGYVVFTSRA